MGSIVYRATLTAEGSEDIKYYIGSSNNFKLRYGRHKQAFNNVDKKTDCQLSEYYWSFKDKGLQPKVKFEVISKAKEYNPKTKKCFLCTKEKLEIINSLHVPKKFICRSELMKHCLHRDKHLLSSLNLQGFKPPLDPIARFNKIAADGATVLRNGKALR